MDPLKLWFLFHLVVPSVVGVAVVWGVVVVDIVDVIVIDLEMKFDLIKFWFLYHVVVIVVVDVV